MPMFKGPFTEFMGNKMGKGMLGFAMGNQASTPMRRSGSNTTRRTSQGGGMGTMKKSAGSMGPLGFAMGNPGSAPMGRGRMKVGSAMGNPAKSPGRRGSR